MKSKQEIFINGQDYTSDVNGFLERTGLGSVASGRCSALLYGQLFHDSVLTGERNPFKVLEQISALEGRGGLSRTKDETLFTGKFLKGLWHKHYVGDGVRPIAVNVERALKTYGLPETQRLVAEAEARGEVRDFSEQDIAAMVNEAVHGNYMRRAKDSALTGDWLVFARHEGLNYYLCVAAHETGDENIREWIDRLCVPEFPFLKEILV